MFLASKFHIDISLIDIYSLTKLLLDELKIKFIHVEIDPYLSKDTKVTIIDQEATKVISNFKLEKFNVGAGCLSLPFSISNEGI